MANLTKMTNYFRRIANFAKFAVFVKSAALLIPPLSLTPSNPSLSGGISSNRQFRQICLLFPFRQNGWRNFVKFAIFVVACIPEHVSGMKIDVQVVVIFKLTIFFLLIMIIKTTAPQAY